MKYYGKIENPEDLITRQYADTNTIIPDKDGYAAMTRIGVIYTMGTAQLKDHLDADSNCAGSFFMNNSDGNSYSSSSLGYLLGVKSSMPNYKKQSGGQGTDSTNKYVLYVGETNENFKFGHIYQYEWDSTGEELVDQWKDVSFTDKVSYFESTSIMKSYKYAKNGDLAILIEGDNFGLYQYNTSLEVDETFGYWRKIGDNSASIIDGGNAQSVYDSSINSYNIDGGGA